MAGPLNKELLLRHPMGMGSRFVKCILFIVQCLYFYLVYITEFLEYHEIVLNFDFEFFFSQKFLFLYILTCAGK